MMSSRQHPSYKVEVYDTRQVQYFNSLNQAKDWLQREGKGTIKELRVIDYAYPLAQKQPLSCWIPVQNIDIRKI